MTWAAKIFGGLGFMCYLLAFQCKSSRGLIFLNFCGDAVYALQMFLLGGYTGCLTLVIASIYGLIQCCYGRKWAMWQGWKWVFAALYLLSTVLTWENIFSILPFIGAATVTFTNWTRNGRIIRLSRLCIVAPVWLIYDVYAGSWSGALCQILSIASILISICRYGMKRLDQVD